MKEQSGAVTRKRKLGTVFSTNREGIPPPSNQMHLKYIHICGSDGSVRRKRHVDHKVVPASTLGGWWDSGGAGAGPRFAAQARIDAPLSPNNPFRWYSGRHLGGQSVYNGRGSAEDRADMVVFERRKLSEKIGCGANNFSSLKKVSASPLLHHSVGKGYYEGVMPRCLDCCQWEAHRQHILRHYLLAQMGFVFMMKFDAKFSFAQAAQAYLPTKIKFSEQIKDQIKHSSSYLEDVLKWAPRSLYQTNFIIDYGLQHPSKGESIKRLVWYNVYETSRRGCRLSRGNARYIYQYIV